MVSKLPIVCKQVDAKELVPSMLADVKQTHKRMLHFCFLLFDDDRTHSLDKAEVKAMARQLGQKLTDAELRGAMKEMDPSGNCDCSRVFLKTS